MPVRGQLQQRGVAGAGLAGIENEAVPHRLGAVREQQALSRHLPVQPLAGVERAEFGGRGLGLDPFGEGQSHHPEGVAVEPQVAALVVESLYEN